MELDPQKQSGTDKMVDQNSSQKATPVNLSTPSNTGEQKTSPDKGADASIVQNIPQSVEKNQKQGAIENTVRRIRTYKEDIAEAVRTQKASLTSVVAAEQKRRTSLPKDITQKPPADFKKIGTALGSIILMILGIGVIGFFVFFYEKEEIVIEQDIPSLIFVERQKEIDITGKNARGILQTIEAEKANVSLPLGQIEHLYVTKTTQEQETEVTRIISATEFLESTNAQVSSAFLRSIDLSFMLGVHVFNQNQPFIIFKSNSYQHSFAGLLEWERTMYRDLFLFTGRKADPVFGVPIDPQTGAEIVLKENFEDRIIQNIDVRALANETGGIELLYAFPNQQTLIITTNENTLVEIVTRLNSVRVF